MRPDSSPNTPTTSESAKPGKPGKPINTKFVQDARLSLTPAQARAMEEHKRTSRQVERQWVQITGIRLPE